MKTSAPASATGLPFSVSSAMSCSATSQRLPSGVVAALDEDTARQGDAGGRLLHGEGARRRAEPPCRCLRRGGGERHRFAVDEESVTEREHAPSSEAILERDRSLVGGDHGAAEAVGGELDDEVAFHRHGRDDASALGSPVAGEHVGAVAVGSVRFVGRSRHRSRLADVGRAAR